MGNEDSKMDTFSMGTEDEAFDDIMDEVSLEIDDDYKSLNTGQLNTIPSNSIMDSVKKIKSIHNLYIYQRALGKGVSGRVILVKSRATHRQYALKEMEKTTQNETSFLREINVLRVISHPNIITFDEAFISNTNYYLTTAYCFGGTLLDRVIEMQRFSEKDCANFMRNILDALDYLHSKNIAHRDIKCRNIMFDNRDIKNSKLKLIDFGESELITNYNDKDYSIIGSPHYLCPEITRLRTKFELFAGDCWAAGIVCYIMATGSIPFNGKDTGAIIHKIQTKDVSYRNNINLSASCKHFIASLLNKDPKLRFNTKQALKHEWISGTAVDNDFGNSYFNKLTRMKSENELEEVMIDVILSKIDENEIIETTMSSNTKPTTRGQRGHKPTFTQQSLDIMDIDKILGEIDKENKLVETRKNSLKISNLP